MQKVVQDKFLVAVEEKLADCALAVKTKHLLLLLKNREHVY